MREPRTDILAAYEAALVASDPEVATANAVRAELASFGAGRIDIVAIGKAAVPMVRGAVAALGGHDARAFILTKDEHDLGLVDPAWTIRFGAHPVLEQRNVEATTELLNWLATEPPAPITLCLISGGGSALLERPRDGISLIDFQQVTRLLLRAGADITELNTVRSAISDVKGGGLRTHIQSPRCLSYLLSDVLGNDPKIIASGPTVMAAHDPAAALAVLAHFGLTPQVPAPVLDLLNTPPSPSLPIGANDQITVIADNTNAAEAAVVALQDRGYRTIIGGWELTGEAKTIAREWVGMLAKVGDDIDAVVGGGELTVTVRGSGSGGRNTEFALAAAISLAEQGLTGWTVASLATDGQDASTGSAGAIVTSATIAGITALGIDPAHELAANNSFPPLDQIGATVNPGPTGTNVNDCYFGVRSRPA